MGGDLLALHVLSQIDDRPPAFCKGPSLTESILRNRVLASQEKLSIWLLEDPAFGHAEVAIVPEKLGRGNLDV
jgi:hypothetical protein